MLNLKGILVSAAVVLVLPTWALGQNGSASTSSTKPATAPTETSSSTPGSFDQVVDRIVARERIFNEQMHQVHPLLETYIQTMRTDHEVGSVPAGDQYFLGRFDLEDQVKDRAFLDESGKKKKGIFSKFTGVYTTHFIPRGFAQMAVLDDNIQRQNYDFTFIRREFLGEIRCLVIDVQPRKGSGTGRFIGRIWVEDRDYNVVRFNGTYGPAPRFAHYLHFDSWRLNLRPGMWIPSFIYSEESGMKSGFKNDYQFKAQTRLWGYDLKRQHNEEFTQILVDAPDSLHDQTEANQDATPVESERLWERQAEDNVMERLQKVGLLAPEGEVDKILQTVANNLIVTNNLNIEPEVRTRVLLTLPLESFTIGHTIVLSRGLLDVLPDESSLAMVIAHELSHINLGHRLDTKVAFNDRMFFADENTFDHLDFTRNPEDEEAADKRALELLDNSPYKNKLQSAALFLKALQMRAPDLKNLIRSHLGNSLADAKTIRMSALMNSAPQLEMRRTDQVAALPLGGRIRLDPWTTRVELVKAKPVALTSAREKMPFEVTPFFPYLTRYSNAAPDKVALTEPAK